MYTYKTTIRLHHTDAAGILFFAHLFVIAHECYESFLEPEVTFNSIFNEKNLKMPIVHAEADYYKPLRTSDKITITPQLENIGDSSFSIVYDVHTENGENAAKVKTNHVLRELKGNRPRSLPEKLRAKLESIER